MRDGLAPASRLGGGRGRIALALVASVGCLVLVEVGLRLAPADSRLGQESARPQVPPPRFIHLLQPDPDPHLRFHLRPDLEEQFLGEWVRTNRHGFRGAELSEGGDRLVGIGDSVMFGWGVGEEETYPARLGVRLGALGRNVEVVNLACPKYNTVQEVAWLERNLELLRPRWVILGYLGNDVEPVSELFERASWWERHSHLYRLLELRWRGSTAGQGRREMLDALGRLGALSREYGFSVLAFLYAGRVTAQSDPNELPHSDVREACREQGFHVVDLHTMLIGAIERGEIETSFDLWRRREPPVDAHPSASGHDIIARGLAEELAALL